jgi:hypothetical protein
MFKRRVEIADLSTGGISLKVTFNILPACWPALSVPYQTVGGGASSNGLLVYSPRFKLVSEGEKWIKELTDEVKTLVTLDRELTDKFKRLEGEEIV